MSEQTIDASTILSWIQARIAQELNCAVDEIDFDQPMDLLGLDSVSLLWIAGELAEWLNIEITTAMVFENTSLPKLSQKTYEIYLASQSAN